jgi:hypothetical protein
VIADLASLAETDVARHDSDELPLSDRVFHGLRLLLEPFVHRAQRRRKLAATRTTSTSPWHGTGSSSDDTWGPDEIGVLTDPHPRPEFVEEALKAAADAKPTMQIEHERRASFTDKIRS